MFQCSEVIVDALRRTQFERNGLNLSLKKHYPAAAYHINIFSDVIVR